MHLVYLGFQRASVVPTFEVWSSCNLYTCNLCPPRVCPCFVGMTPQLPVFPADLFLSQKTSKQQEQPDSPTTTPPTDSHTNRIRFTEPVHPARHQVRPHHPLFNRITGTGKACLWESSPEHRALPSQVLVRSTTAGKAPEHEFLQTLTPQCVFT
jgi:hypothetical protein